MSREDDDEVFDVRFRLNVEETLKTPSKEVIEIQSEDSDYFESEEEEKDVFEISSEEEQLSEKEEPKSKSEEPLSEEETNPKSEDEDSTPKSKLETILQQFPVESKYVKSIKKKKEKKEEKKEKKEKKVYSKKFLEEGEKGQYLPETKVHKFLYKVEYKIEWIGTSKNGHYKSVKINDCIFNINDFAYFLPPGHEHGVPYWIVWIKDLYEVEGEHLVNGIWFFRDFDIYRQQFSKWNEDPYRLYLDKNPNFEDTELLSIQGKCNVQFIKKKSDFIKEKNNFYCQQFYDSEKKEFTNLTEDILKQNVKPTPKEEEELEGDIIRCLDLFCGAGGFSYGMERNPKIKVTTSIDFFPAAVTTYLENNPHTNCYLDCVKNYLRRVKILDKHRKRIEKHMDHLGEFSNDEVYFDLSNDVLDRKPNKRVRRERQETTGYSEIKEIKDVREKQDGSLEYLVSWVGWKSSFDSWLNEEDILSPTDFEQLLKKHKPKGSFDFIFGGPPCQSFSSRNSSKRKDNFFEDERNALVLTFLDFVDYYQPKYFLIENVVGMLSVIDEVEEKIKTKLGYQVKFGILNSSHFGVPQSRNRVFIWGCQQSCQLPEYPYHLTSSKKITLIVGKEIKFNVHNPSIITSGPLPRVILWDIFCDLPEAKETRESLEYITEPTNIYQEKLRKDSESVEDHIYSNNAQMNFFFPYLPTYYEKPNADWHDLPPEAMEQVTKGMISYRKGSNLLKRLSYTGHSKTLLTRPAPFSDVVIHPEEHRCISVREYARLQGFPDNYKFFGVLYEKYKLIGNAVSTPVAQALGEMLIEVYPKKKKGSREIPKETEKKDTEKSQETKKTEVTKTNEIEIIEIN